MVLAALMRRAGMPEPCGPSRYAANHPGLHPNHCARRQRRDPVSNRCANTDGIAVRGDCRTSPVLDLEGRQSRQAAMHKSACTTIRRFALAVAPCVHLSVPVHRQARQKSPRHVAGIRNLSGSASCLRPLVTRCPIRAARHGPGGSGSEATSLNHSGAASRCATSSDSDRVGRRSS
jgi:hypothetical protein